jgi:predicted esterase
MRFRFGLILAAIYLGFVAIIYPVYSQNSQNDDSVAEFLKTDLSQLRAKAADAYNHGDFEKAIQQYLELLKYNINDKTSLYNLACCYGLLGNDKLATEYLRLAAKAGFDDLEMIRQDKDFARVRQSANFSAVYDSLVAQYKANKSALGNEIYFDACAIFECLAHLPATFDKTKSYPLVVGLHGYGGRADYMIKIWDDFDQPGFIYVAPFAPYHFLLGNRLAYSWNLWLTEGEEFPGEDFDITENYIIKLINDLKSVYNISDVYLMGHSQGASTTYITGIKHHELFKGLIAISGPLGPYWLNDSTLTAGNDLKIMIIHGKNDRTIKYWEGQTAKDLLEKHGYQVEFISHEGGHELPPKTILKQIGRWVEKDK